MTVASNYAIGDTVIFNRAYKTLGMEAGDERRVVGVDRRWKRVDLADGRGRIIKWAPERLAAAKGGVEVHRGVAMDLRAGDRVRWTRNDPGSGLVNGAIATVERIERDGVRFRLEDGSVTRIAGKDPQLHHLDRAWAATVGLLKKSTVCDSLSQYLVFDAGVLRDVGSEEPRSDGVVRLRFAGAAGA